jgi:hypothetical protein
MPPRGWAGFSKRNNPTTVYFRHEPKELCANRSGHDIDERAGLGERPNRRNRVNSVTQKSKVNHKDLFPRRKRHRGVSVREGVMANPETSSWPKP